MTSGFRCMDCNRTFKSVFTFDKHKCQSKTMSKEDLIVKLRHAIQEHKVSSYFIEQMRGKAYDESMDNWINIYYIEEWLNFALKNDNKTEASK